MLNQILKIRITRIKTNFTKAEFHLCNYHNVIGVFVFPINRDVQFVISCSRLIGTCNSYLNMVGELGITLVIKVMKVAFRIFE